MSIPIALYIHFPWCVQKCPYCDFNSHAFKDRFPEDDYIDALIREFTSKASMLQGRQIQTIFMGGGTPSLFSAQSIEKLLTAIDQISSLSGCSEITLEANPGTVEFQKFADFKAAGINRLSMGIQSFQDEQLEKLGRIHSSAEALKAIDAAKSAGIDNFNLDLMYGLEAQSIDDALQDLQIAIDAEPNHISWYQLTIEPNTVFYKFRPQLPDSDFIFELEQKGRALLKENGFQHYEISAYAKSNRQCRHNLNYWTFGDYLGIGAGAHSKITNLNTKEIERHWNVKQPQSYLLRKNNVIAESKIISKDELPLEYFMNLFRLQDFEVRFDDMRDRCGLDYSDVEGRLAKAQGQDYLDFDKEKIKLNDLGNRYLNDLLEIFV